METLWYKDGTGKTYIVSEHESPWEIAEMPDGVGSPIPVDTAIDEVDLCNKAYYKANMTRGPLYKIEDDPPSCRLATPEDIAEAGYSPEDLTHKFSI